MLASTNRPPQRLCVAVGQPHARLRSGLGVGTSSGAARVFVRGWRSCPLPLQAGPEFFEDLPPGFSDSKLLRSELVQKETTEIIEDFEALARLGTNFPDFDLEGKKIYLEEFEKLTERMRVSRERYKLADDVAGNYLLNKTNVALLNAGMSPDLMHEHLISGIASLKAMVQEEEQTNDPEVLLGLKRSWRQNFEGFSRLPTAMQSPKLLAGMAHPMAMKAFTDIEKRGVSAIENYKNIPELYDTLLHLFRP